MYFVFIQYVVDRNMLKNLFSFLCSKMKNKIKKSICEIYLPCGGGGISFVGGGK